MSFVIEVEFIRSTFDASSLFDNGLPDSLPHPARLHNAFVDAAAQGDVEGAFEALATWELCQPPRVLSPERADSSQRVNYVPTNQHGSTVAEMWKTVYPGRIAKGPRTWPRSAVASAVRYAWDDSSLSDHDLDALELLAKQIPYLGRATSPVVVRCVRGSLEVAPHETELVASDGYDGIELSVARPGYTKALRMAFEQGRPAHEVPRRWVSYVEPKVAPSASSPFDAPVIMALDRPRDPRSVRRLTGALRASLESVLDPGPVELHGHVAAGEVAPRHQVAIVALTASFGEHADGLVRALGLVFPKGLAETSRRSVVRAVGQVDELRMGDAGVVRFDRKPKGLFSLRPGTWTQESATWTTVTPMVSDRYLKTTDEDGWANQVLAACRNSDLPVPSEIDVSEVPWAPGSLRASAYDARRPLPKDPVRRAQRQREKARPAMHVRIRFNEPVGGPILLGNMRYLGLGLCVPVKDVP